MRVAQNIGKTIVYAMVALCLALTTATACYGADVTRQDFYYSEFQAKGVTFWGTDMTAVMSNTIGNGSDISTLPDQTTKIGLDNLYGVSFRMTSYSGETPNPTSDSNGEGVGISDLQNYPHVSVNTSIFGYWRTWWNDPTAISEDLEWSDKSTKDIHGMTLAGSHSSFGGVLENAAGAWAYTLAIGITTLSNAISGTLVHLANIDLTWLTEQAQLDSLSKAINDIFIQSNGQLSPLIIIALVIFIGSLVALIIKRVMSGTASFKEIGQEFGYLFLSFIIAGACLSGGLLSVSKSMSIASSGLIGGLTNSTDGGDLSLFSYETGNPTENANYTEVALLSKPCIDGIIKNQFGYSVSELVLYDDSNSDITEKNWGISATRMKEIIASLNWSGDGSVFVITNEEQGLSSTAGYANLGYFWYANCSDTDVKDPFDIKNGVVTRNTPSQALGSGNLYIADLMAAIDADTGGSSKARQVLSNFESGYNDWIGVLPILLVSGIMPFAIGFAAIYSLIARVFFVIGILAVAVMPVLLLTPIRGIRGFAKQFVFTWLTSGLKMVLGLALVFICISMSAIFSSGGAIGQFIDIAFLIGMAILGPKIFAAFNSAVSSTAIGRNQLGFMKTLDGKVNGFANKDRGFNALKANRQALKDKMKRNSDDLTSKDKSVDLLNKGKKDIANDIANGNVMNSQSPNGENASRPEFKVSPEEADEIMQDYGAELQRLESRTEYQKAIDAGIKDKDYLDKAKKVDDIKKSAESLRKSRVNELEKEMDAFNSKGVKLITSFTPTAGLANSLYKIKSNVKDKRYKWRASKIEEELSKAETVLSEAKNSPHGKHVKEIDNVQMTFAQAIHDDSQLRARAAKREAMRELFGKSSPSPGAAKNENASKVQRDEPRGKHAVRLNNIKRPQVETVTQQSAQPNLKKDATQPSSQHKLNLGAKPSEPHEANDIKREANGEE